MAQKWYQKTTVQASLVVGVLTVVGAVIVASINVTQQRSELRQDNKQLKDDLEDRDATIQELTHERDKYQTQLTPFLATANQHFKDVPEEKRLDALSEKLDGMLATVQQGDRDILLKLETIGDAVSSLNQQQPPPGDRSIATPVMDQMTSSLKRISGWQAEILCLMGDGEAYSLAEQIKTLFENAGWKVNGVKHAIFRKPVRRLVLTFGEQPPNELQKALLPLFDSLGYPREAQLNPSQSEKTLKIVVGTR